jgi:hypothetical protein
MSGRLRSSRDGGATSSNRPRHAREVQHVRLRDAPRVRDEHPSSFRPRRDSPSAGAHGRLRTASEIGDCPANDARGRPEPANVGRATEPPRRHVRVRQGRDDADEHLTVPRRRARCVRRDGIACAHTRSDGSDESSACQETHRNRARRTRPDSFVADGHLTPNIRLTMSNVPATPFASVNAMVVNDPRVIISGGAADGFAYSFNFFPTSSSVAGQGRS